MAGYNRRKLVVLYILSKHPNITARKAAPLCRVSQNNAKKRLTHYWRNSYLTRRGKRPYHYQLTKKGVRRLEELLNAHHNGLPLKHPKTLAKKMMINV